MNQPSNQQLRARKDLLKAASRLMQSGKTPNMAEVAAEALMSRATAYRYFQSIEHLLAEAPASDAIDEPEVVLKGISTTDPLARLMCVEEVLHEASYKNEAQLRIMLAHSLQQNPKKVFPARQNRRTPLIEAALEPVRNQFSNNEYTRLCNALALIMGLESMIVCTDVLDIDEKSAKKVKNWAIKALVDAAMASTSK